MKAYRDKIVATSHTFNRFKDCLKAMFSRINQGIQIYQARLIDLTNRFGSRVFFAVLIGIVILLTVFRISGTSMGCYYEQYYGLYGDAKQDPAVLFGFPKCIRSDEYRVSTSWMVAQVQRGFPRYNDLYGLSGQSLFFYDLPVNDFTLIFKPENFAFFVLPFEQAFAFRWWFRSAIFLFAVYLILKRISKGQVLFSILGSLAFLYSPFFQWWYSVPFTDITACYFLMFECFVRLLGYQNRKQIITYALLLAYLSIAMVLLFYPPAQISLGILFLIVSAGYQWTERGSLNRARLKGIAGGIGLSAVLVIVVLGLFYAAYQPALTAINNTIYPGKRITYEYGINPSFLFTGFFNVQMQDRWNVLPKEISFNQSEGSNFFFYSLFLLPVMVFLIAWNYHKFHRLPFWLTLWTGVYLIYLSWMVHWPALPVSKIPIIAMVPLFRLMLAVGVINFLVTVWYLYQTPTPNSCIYRWFCAFYGLIVFAVYLGYGLYFRAHSPDFISSLTKIMVIALFAGVGFFFLINQNKLLFISLCLVFSLYSSFRVNPLYQGLGELTSGKLAQAIQEVNQADGKKSTWILFDSDSLNLLQANGARAINGIYYYPDMKMLHVLDPEGKNEQIYNRYSHIMIYSSESETPIWDLLGPDAFSISINPCSSRIASLNVKYFLFPHDVDYACLKEVRQVKYPKVVFHIYERTP